MTTALVPKEGERALTLSSAALTIQEIVAQKQLIAQAMKELMKEGEHYGKIPGAPKPSLWKPGADLICSIFQLEADYETEEVVHEEGYIYYRHKCILKHIPTGRKVGSGLGSCNSREEKYRRAAPKKCPNCEKETILRSKPRNKAEEEHPEKLGWFCWAKKGGCGRNFAADDAGIVQQDNGIADPSDLDNTILKMSCKRSRIDAVLTATGASDFFGQDLEDLSAKARRLLVGDPNNPEYIPPQGKEGSSPLASPGAASTAAPNASTNATATADRTGATTSKPPRANTIKHDGTFANHKQVTLLHVMRSKVGGLVWCKDSEPCWNDDKTQRAKILCAYHKQLAAFKDCDGKPITSSVDLSEAQISNLIDRYDAKIQQQEARAQETPDIGAAFDQAEENARLRGMIEEPGAEG